MLAQEPTDALLVERIMAGDVGAFETLVRRDRAPLRKMAMRMLGDWADAEDVVQDVFAIAWDRIDELADPAALRGWLFQIARRRCLMVLRKKRGRRTDPVGEVPEDHAAVGGAKPMTDPQRLSEASAGVVALNQALADLPAAQREVWLLAELEGLSYSEIAKRVGTGEQAVRGRLFRARAGLAESLRGWR